MSTSPWHRKQAGSYFTASGAQIVHEGKAWVLRGEGLLPLRFKLYRDAKRAYPAAAFVRAAGKRVETSRRSTFKRGTVFRDWNLTDLEEFLKDLPIPKRVGALLTLKAQPLARGHWRLELNEGTVIASDLKSRWPDLQKVEDFVEGADLDEWYPGFEDRGNEEFWQYPSELYHNTSEEAAERILAEGLEARSESRGLSNRAVGAAVFTTRDLGETDSVNAGYGSAVIIVDAMVMKRDGLAPYVGGEPPLVEAEARRALAYKVGLEEYEGENHYDLSPNTVVVYGSIPAKYLRLYED